jgi:hypothetical protein
MLPRQAKGRFYSLIDHNARKKRRRHLEKKRQTQKIVRMQMVEAKYALLMLLFMSFFMLLSTRVKFTGNN